MIAANADPNWLLSTTVQASAALVGIVGGLLISRLVALSGERSGLQRQLGVAEVEEGRERAVLEECRSARLDDAAWRLRRDAVSAIANSIDDVDVDATIEQHGPRGTSAGELRPYVVELVDHVRQVYGTLATQLALDDLPYSIEEVVEQGVRFDPVDEDIVGAVLVALRARRPRSVPFNEVLPLRLSAMLDSTLYARQQAVIDGLLAQETDARHAHEAACARVELAAAALELKGQPARLKEALVVLIAFALLGIVYPSLILAVGPTSLRWFWRLSVVGLFLLGLACLLGYLVQSVKGLSLTSDSPPEP